MASVDLTAFCPPACPHGHVLRYGGNSQGRFIPHRMLVSWTPCDCPASRERGGTWGHVTVECTACERAGRKTAFYDPPCGAPAGD
jgi:hypothetical protein